MSKFASRRSTALGPDARPVAIPNDLANTRAKAHGFVELPEHIRWSGPSRRYDLRDRRDRALVYEQVLTEGTEDDVRYYVDLDQLVNLWDDLVLPRLVCHAWSTWLRAHRGIVKAC